MYEGWKKDAWNSLRAQRQRCNNPNASDYKYYGGRGIQALCSTKEFFIWWRVPQLSIERAADSNETLIHMAQKFAGDMHDGIIETLLNASSTEDLQKWKKMMITEIKKRNLGESNDPTSTEP